MLNFPYPTKFPFYLWLWAILTYFLTYFRKFTVQYFKIQKGICIKICKFQRILADLLEFCLNADMYYHFMPYQNCCNLYLSENKRGMRFSKWEIQNYGQNYICFSSLYSISSSIFTKFLGTIHRFSHSPLAANTFRVWAGFRPSWPTPIRHVFDWSLFRIAPPRRALSKWTWALMAVASGAPG